VHYLSAAPRKNTKQHKSIKQLPQLHVFSPDSKNPISTPNDKKTDSPN